VSKDDKNKVETTGHEWDGIQELNNPLPRWWVWIFFACIVWGIGYTIAYPAWPLINKATPGLLGFSTRANVATDIAEFKEMNAEIDAQLASADLTAIEPGSDLYNYGMNYGEATFAAFCSQCHGSGAAGANGYPNLLDNDWLWGGSADAIKHTLVNGRQAAMPAWKDILGEEGIQQTTAYILELNNRDRDDAMAAEGKQLYQTYCVACHGPEAMGNQALGAPNLTNGIWLYGGTQSQIAHTLRVGRNGVMPAFGGQLGEDKIHLLTAYIYGLSR
jgi:cytochrome c oxidase cbb3-type subunit 3